MIRYRCPTCNASHESEDHAAGTKHACMQCGQRLQVPGRVNKTVLGKVEEPAELPESNLPLAIVPVRSEDELPGWVERWIWCPPDANTPENSGETIVRFILNLARLRFGLLLFQWVLAVVALLICWIVLVCWRWLAN